MVFLRDYPVNIGIEHFISVTGRNKGAIEDHFDKQPELEETLAARGKTAELEALAKDLPEAGCASFVRQQEPLGLGHAVSLGADFAGDDDCVVALGDSLNAAEEPAAPLRAMIKAYRQLGAAAMVAVEKVPPEETFRYGIVSINGAEPPLGEPVVITDVVEKPPPGTAPTTLAVAARYVFSPAIFEALKRTVPDKQGEIQLTDAIRLLIHMGKPVYAWPFYPDQRRYDIGNFESYFRTFIDFALADERYGYLVRKYIKSKAYEL